MKRFTVWVGAMLLMIGTTAYAADDILIEDFENDTYGQWKAEGDAFGPGPAKGTLGSQQTVTGFQGKQLVNTFFNGDKTTGTLTSPEFAIERKHINFLIGGGAHAGQTCVNLLIDGKVVKSTAGPNDRPGGSEELAWTTWDTEDLIGKKAVIQIVDKQTGSWGHVNADQFVQSDIRLAAEPMKPEDLTREITLDKQYLLLPIDNEAKRCRITITVDGQPVHEGDINLATGEPDWWTYLDVSELADKTATISVNTLKAGTHGIKAIETADEPRLPNLYDETYRPQFHFSQKRGWNNDPNGMVYHDGEYHLYWQSNPLGLQWANMYWGHATSPDMIHWTEHKLALRPWVQAVRNCFSGSAVVDTDNTAGFQVGDEPPIIAAFTDTGSGEVIAYSNDRGRTFTLYEGNPVVKHSGRDPKLVWYEPGKHWVMALFSTVDKKQGLAFYTSPDLKKWEFASHIPGYFECAEIFELPVDGDADNTRWVIFAADAEYAIGSFDGKTFTPEHEGKHRVHNGPYYASQTFSQTPDGRRVQIGWARIQTKDAPFNQTFSLPTELTLKTTDDGIRMFVNPISELESLRQYGEKTENQPLEEGKPLKIDTNSQLLDIAGKIDVGTAKTIELKFGENVVTYDVVGQKLDGIPLKLEDGKLDIRVLVDRPMYEIVGQGGRVYKTAARKDAGGQIDSIILTAQGGTATLVSGEIYEMKSCWQK